MDFDTVISFHETLPWLPSSQDVLNVMLASPADYADYITYYVWSGYTGDLFYDVNRVHFLPAYSGSPGGPSVAPSYASPISAAPSSRIPAENPTAAPLAYTPGPTREFATTAAPTLMPRGTSASPASMGPTVPKESPTGPPSSSRPSSVSPTLPPTLAPASPTSPITPPTTVRPTVFETSSPTTETAMRVEASLFYGESSGILMGYDAFTTYIVHVSLG